MANRLVEHYGGEVPGRMEDLVSLPGVGRKTANVVRSVALGLPGLPVDTHVQRLTRRLGITAETDPVKIEHEIDAILPGRERGSFSLRIILHGRRVCIARKPKCAECSLDRRRCCPGPASCRLDAASRHNAVRNGIFGFLRRIVARRSVVWLGWVLPGSRHLVIGDIGIRRPVSPRQRRHKRR